MRWFRRHWSQFLRRFIQVCVVAFIAWAAFGAAWRNYKVAHNHERMVRFVEGDTWAKLYTLNERALGTFGEPYKQSLNYLGMPWASTVGGVAAADPIMVASFGVKNQDMSLSLLGLMIVPLLLALVLGKVFCSHLCPMRLMFELGQMVRRGLERVGVFLPEMRSDARYGGWVLLGGMLATLTASTAVWLFILPYVALSASIFLYVSTGVVSGLLVSVAVWLIIDLFFAPGYFCHNVCPTGFLLEKVGRWSLFRLRKVDPNPCPENCFICEDRCPYALSPKEETHTPACDNCGQCAAVCPSSRLERRFHLPVIAGVLALFMLAPSLASAHHNKGLPHYGYYDNYPQVPTEEHVAIDGKWEFGATIFNFQGYDRKNSETPNDVKIFCYLYHLGRDKAYLGAADFEIRIGDELVSKFHRDKVDEEAIYSTRETLPRTGTYRLIAYVDGKKVAVLKFYAKIGEDGINWLLIGGIAFPILLLFGLAWVGRKQRFKNKRGRRRRQRAEEAR